MRSSFGNAVDLFYGVLDIIPMSVLGQGLIVNSNPSGTGFAQLPGQLNGGISGGDYPSIGYNWVPNGGSQTANYAVNDYSSRIRFGTGGIQLQVAASGSAGASVAFSTAMQIGFGGDTAINAPSVNRPALTVTGPSNNYTLVVNGSTVNGQSYGMIISAGTNGSDQSFGVVNVTGSSTHFSILGSGRIAFHGAIGLLQVPGWGVPVSGGVVANFPGTAATLSQCGAALSEIIGDLKSLGIYGA